MVDDDVVAVDTVDGGRGHDAAFLISIVAGDIRVDPSLNNGHLGHIFLWDVLHGKKEQNEDDNAVDEVGRIEAAVVYRRISALNF